MHSAHISLALMHANHIQPEKTAVYNSHSSGIPSHRANSEVST